MNIHQSINVRAAIQRDHDMIVSLVTKGQHVSQYYYWNNAPLYALYRKYIKWFNPYK